MPLLHWLTRDADIHVATHAPYRLLEESPDLSSGDRDTGNMLIQGDNLDALKALQPYYAGKVKCIYIDPPYNTRSAFEHYDDNIEHTKWLAMIYPRLELLRSLLAEDGSIWVSIDDNEGHYLKVIMDEIFGRRNFVSNVIWQKIYTIKNSARHLSEMHDHILVYARGIDSWQRNLLPRSDELNDTFTNPDNDPNGAWTTNAVQARNFYSQGSYPITSPNGKVFYPPNGTYWRVSEENFNRLNSEGRVWWGKNGSAIPRIKRYLSEVKQGVVPTTLWLHTEAGQNAEAKDEIRSLSVDGDIFTTPKPERLVKRILEIATKTGDLVLDSFLGSATTAAVAHKMNRRYIGIEMGEHAVTHCAPRLQKVIEGEQGGISKSVDWTGGGGFRFYRLGVPVFDENGHVSEGIRFAPLAAHLWFVSTGIPFSGHADSSFLGSHDGIGYYLLYNGILGDKRPNGGNVLTAKVLSGLPPHDGAKVIFGESCRLSAERLIREGITFRQIPYEIQAR